MLCLCELLVKHSKKTTEMAQKNLYFIWTNSTCVLMTWVSSQIHCWLGVKYPELNNQQTQLFIIILSSQYFPKQTVLIRKYYKISIAFLCLWQHGWHFPTTTHTQMHTYGQGSSWSHHHGSQGYTHTVADPLHCWTHTEHCRHSMTHCTHICPLEKSYKQT